MSLVLLLNLVILSGALIASNDWLAWNAYVLYALQAVTMLPYLLHRAFFVRNLFCPSLFALTFSLVNLTLGGYLVPRGFGFNKQYTDVVLGIESHTVIATYLILANLVMFIVATRTIHRLAAASVFEDEARPRTAPMGIFVQLLCAGAFLLVSALRVPSVFSFQIALMIVHLSSAVRDRSRFRYLHHLFYLAVMTSMGFENKREIVMALFVIIFLEAYFTRSRLRLSVSQLIGASAFGVLFFGLVLTASVLRGYGNFDPVTTFDALRVVPQYARSDIFADGITDNLELNYGYGAAVTSIALMLDGTIPYQFGAGIVKVLFLPIPRALVDWKPESVLQVYTESFAPEQWAIGGSLPVPIASEMFVNFAFLGLLALALIWIAIDNLFVRIFSSGDRPFTFYSCIFLCMLVLMLARGSGLEQYLLYYLVAMPVFLVAPVWQIVTDERIPPRVVPVGVANAR